MGASKRSGNMAFQIRDKKHLQSTTSICGRSPKHPASKATFSNCDDRRLPVLNGNQVKIQPKSAEKYKTMMKIKQKVK